MQLLLWIYGDKSMIRIEWQWGQDIKYSNLIGWSEYNNMKEIERAVNTMAKNAEELKRFLYYQIKEGKNAH